MQAEYASPPGGAVARDSALPGRIIPDAAAPFRERFNLSSFTFSHSLAGHPLFEIPRLAELAKTMWGKGGGNVTCHTGETPFDQGWDNVRPKALSIVDAVARIRESGSWVLLKSVQEVPEYGALMERCLDELTELTGVALREEITWVDVYIFIGSPRSVTPYHMDPESTFLFQIHGEKDYHLFDPADRTILTEQEIERYYAGDLSAAKYKGDNQSQAQVHHLRPGVGLHQPVRAPHWVKYGDDFSVTLSILFLMRQYTRQAKIYQVNHFLRQLGRQPTPPGRSALRDSLKVLALSSPGHRPKTKSDLLRHGLSRLDMAKKLAGRLTRGHVPAQ